MALKQKRQGFRLSAQKALDLMSSLQNQDTNVAREQLQKKATLLKSYLERIEPLDNEILADTTEVAAIEQELESIRMFNDRLLEAIADAVTVVQQPGSPLTAANATFASGGFDTKKVKLPQLQIPAFEGDPLRWQEFWDAFKASIDDRSDLKPVDKLTYLRGLLKGDPFNLIEGFRVTEANYQPAVDMLSQRYGVKQAIIFAHVEALLLISPASGDVSSLGEMHANLERHFRSLDSLQPEPDAILYSVLLSKLPRFLKVEAHRQRGTRDDWDFKKLREWLHDEIRAREMGDRLHHLHGDDRKESKSSDSKHGASSKDKRNEGKAGKFARTASFLVSQSKPAQCPFCDSAHEAEEYSEYGDTQSRRSRLGNRCISCLGRGHIAKDCRRRRPCRHCQRPGHHPSLCFNRFGKPTQVNNATCARASESSVENSQRAKRSLRDPIVNLTANLSQQPSQPTTSERTIMQTALVDVVDVAGTRRVKARILFDTGASRSFITAKKQAELKMSVSRREHLSVSTFQSSQRITREYKFVDFGIQCRDGTTLPVTAAVVPTITCPIQKVAYDECHLTVPEWTLAEPIIKSSEYVEIDILIGMDYYHTFIQPHHVQAGDNLWFLSSKVGYVLSGRVSTSDKSPETVAVMLFRTVSDAQLAEPSIVDLSKYWDLEEIGMKEIRDGGTPDDDALSSFMSTVKFENSRYKVCWPWKIAQRELNDNRALAYGRLKSVVNQLKKSPGLLEAYHDVFRNQLDSGIIEKAPCYVGNSSPVYYMPHHGVYSPNKPTTKLRIVFDASSNVNARVASLNESLHRGPVFLEDLCGLLLRFRTHPIALVSDIEKAFLQIGLQMDQRDVTRFLWLQDYTKPPAATNIATYRFCRVPFGVISSPFLLAATVVHHLKKQSSATASKIANDIYVDNVISGEASLSEAIAHYNEAESIFHAASMNLREWYSNSPDLMHHIREEDKGKSTEPKILGFHWNTMSDTLRLGAVKQLRSTERMTKRLLLKVLAQIVDPCGFIASVIVVGKLLIQDLLKRKCGWDEEVPNDVAEQWRSFIATNIGCISSVNIPRYVGCAEASRLELHGFCDASTKACAVALYLRIEMSESRSTTTLLIAKTRLAPMKQKVTIPRMELIAVVLGTRLIRFVSTHLRLALQAKYLWTDSQCVLHWMKKEQLATNFIANRIKELRKVEDVCFRFVPSKDNPADLPTRGCDIGRLQESTIWWNGPQWLSQSVDSWPNDFIINDAAISKAEACLLETSPAHKQRQFSSSMDKIIINEEDFSTLGRLLRVTALVFRFLHNCRTPSVERRCGNLLLEEISNAHLWWVKQMQNVYLEANSASKVGKISTFRDDQGLIRCHGRIDNSTVPYDARYPILLSKRSHITNLIIQSYHERAFHGGVAVTLCNLRQQYWILSGRSVVKKMIRSCKVCIRFNGGAFRLPEAPPMPTIRLEESPPFSQTGLDYLGPLVVSDREETMKVWICLYTCAVSRAVHLEVVISLSTEHFLLALKRFVALYGIPKVIVSDNARQFQTAAKIIRKFELQASNSSDFQEFSLSKGVEWKFIPEMSPWMGDFTRDLSAL